MEEVKRLLKKQNEILIQNQEMMSEHVSEFIRLLKLQAAEAKVSNARLDMIEASQQKLLIGITGLGETSKILLEEFGVK